MCSINMFWVTSFLPYWMFTPSPLSLKRAASSFVSNYPLLSLWHALYPALSHSVSLFFYTCFYFLHPNDFFLSFLHFSSFSSTERLPSRLSSWIFTLTSTLSFSFDPCVRLQFHAVYHFLKEYFYFIVLVPPHTQ